MTSERVPAIPNAGSPLVILIPVFNDWKTLQTLLRSIDETLDQHRIDAELVLIDDGSTELPGENFTCPPLTAAKKVTLIELRRNLGHQRAIAVALSYIHERLASRAVLIMDGDGEDSPDDIPRLLAKFEACRRRKIIFAAREKRSESLKFRVCYGIYQLLHRILTGYGIRVGNFSIVPPRALAQLVVSSEIWNHYAAAVVNSRIEYGSVPTRRAPRLGGRSTMDFTALVVHGLSALSVYSHTIGVRLLQAVGVLAAITIMVLCGIVGARMALGVSISQNTLYLVGLLLVISLQSLVAGVIFVFIILADRQSASFIPAREYQYFVGKVTELGCRS